MKKLAFIWGTWFGSGYFPIASGTAGSLAAIPFVWGCALLGPSYLLAFAIFTFITGVWASHVVSKATNNGDPQIVVIDEVHGQALSLLLISLLNPQIFDPTTFKAWFVVGVSFILFRIFDVAKPWPASFFDKKMHGGWGMMLDDSAAGIYAMIGTYLIYFLVF